MGPEDEVYIMIDVTKMNNEIITINADLIEMIEEVPDTVITLTTGKKILVKESRQTVKSLVKLYKRDVFCQYIESDPHGETQ